MGREVTSLRVSFVYSHSSECQCAPQPARDAAELRFAHRSPVSCTDHWGPRLVEKDRSNTSLVFLLTLQAVGERSFCTHRYCLVVLDKLYLEGSRYQ